MTKVIDALTEDQHQILLMVWCRKMALAGVAQLANVFHVANGGMRSKSEASRLKQMGVKAGVSDIFVPCNIGQRGGLWIEMKCETGKVSGEQKAWLHSMEQEGYATAVCWNWAEAVATIRTYLSPVVQNWPTIDMTGSVERVAATGKLAERGR